MDLEDLIETRFDYESKLEIRFYHTFIKKGPKSVPIPPLVTICKFKVPFLQYPLINRN